MLGFGFELLYSDETWSGRMDDGWMRWERTRYLFAFLFVRLYVTNAREEEGRGDKRTRKRRNGMASKRRKRMAWSRGGLYDTDGYLFISFNLSFLFGWDWNGGGRQKVNFEMYEYLVTVFKCLKE